LERIGCDLRLMHSTKSDGKWVQAGCWMAAFSGLVLRPVVVVEWYGKTWQGPLQLLLPLHFAALVPGLGQVLRHFLNNA